MDHTEALRLQAAEKYILKELSPLLMEEYEEHFFDCAECARDIKFATTLVDASREVFRQKPELVSEPELVTSTGGWFNWLNRLRPIIAVPVLAGVMLLIGYQAWVTPRKQNQAKPVTLAQQAPLVATVQTYVTSFPIHGLARGERSGPQDLEKMDRVSVPAGQGFDLTFDFLPEAEYDHYSGQLMDETGRAVLAISLTPEMKRKEIHVPVAAGSVHGGIYDLIITGDPLGKGQFQSDKEAQHFTFKVEILP